MVRPALWLKLAWRKVALWFALWGALMAALSACSTPADGGPHRLQGQTMGTVWSVLIDAPLDTASLSALHEQIVEELARLNSLMSTWDPESQLSRFNTRAGVEPQPLHPETLGLIDQARRIGRLADGAYDITLQPLSRLWGFAQHSDDSPIPPDPAALAALEPVLGQDKLVRIDNTLRKRHPAVMLDLSSIAKGHAVDRVGMRLEAGGVQRYLVDIGGEIRTRTGKPGTRQGRPWQVGVEWPDGSTPAGLELHDAHVASSGSYRHYRQIDGQRISHILDGRTLAPVQHRLASVTVLHKSTALADAWATALMALGEEDGWRLVESEALAVQMIVAEGGGESDAFRVRRSARFEALLVPAAQ